MKKYKEIIMNQIMFEEVEFYGKTLYVCNLCEKCMHKCKIKSEIKNMDILCKKYKRKEA